MTEALKTLWHTLATVAPKALLFIAILAAGWFIARLIGSVVAKVLLRAGFDRLLDKAGLDNVLGHTQGHQLVGKLAYYSALIVVLQLAFGVFGPNPVSSLISSVIAFLPRLAVALALVVVAGIIASKVRDLITNAVSGLSYANTVGTAAQVLIVGLGVIAALGQIGVALTVTLPVLVTILATGAGILIVGVGGGLIKPMQERWESYLDAAETLTQRRHDPILEPEPEARSATITVTRDAE
jgi:hypothetical protein